MHELDKVKVQAGGAGGGGLPDGTLPGVRINNWMDAETEIIVVISICVATRVLVSSDNVNHRVCTMLGPRTSSSHVNHSVSSRVRDWKVSLTLLGRL